MDEKYQEPKTKEYSTNIAKKWTVKYSFLSAPRKILPEVNDAVVGYDGERAESFILPWKRTGRKKKVKQTLKLRLEMQLTT